MSKRTSYNHLRRALGNNFSLLSSTLSTPGMQFLLPATVGASASGFKGVSTLPHSFGTSACDPAELAIEDQESCGYKKDQWDNVQLKDICREGTILGQLCVGTLDETNPNIHDLIKIGASQYVTNSTTFGTPDLSIARDMLQVLPPVDSKTGQHSFPSRQTAVFFVIDKEILAKYGHLPIAVGKAVNNKSKTHVLPCGTPKDFKIGEGHGFQMFIPHNTSKDHKKFYLELFDKAMYAISQPCNVVSGHKLTLDSYSYVKFSVEKGTGDLLNVSSKSFKAKDGGTIELGPTPPPKPVSKLMTYFPIYQALTCLPKAEAQSPVSTTTASPAPTSP